ncbi:MAG: VWA domain-containing protein [Caldicoprobacterales bacterium]
MNRKVNRKGITLIELILSMALVGLVIVGSTSVLIFSNKVHRKSVTEYDIQASARLITEHTNRIARFSTAVFTIPKSSFRPDNLTKGWSYIGVLDDAVVLYEYGEKDGVIGHHLTELVPANPNITYSIQFHKSQTDVDEKIIGYSIQGFVKGKSVELDENGNPVGHINIFSQTESLNSLQVIHRGTALDPAVALAFRSDTRDAAEYEIIQPVAQVTMVLDVSGSMNYRMDGNTTNNNSLRRITYLKSAASELIEKFAASEYPVYMALVPFSTHADNPGEFQHVQTKKNALLSEVNGLIADGGTNTGDGIRRAYYRILQGRENPDFSERVVSDYIIILVDGVTTFATRTGWQSSSPYRTSDGNIGSPYNRYDYYYSHIHGLGNELCPQGTAYVNLMGSYVVNDGKIKVFVIGFSSRSSDLASVDDIVEATGAEPKFLAGNLDELNLAFEQIQKEIISDLWYIDGPKY